MGIAWRPKLNDRRILISLLQTFYFMLNKLFWRIEKGKRREN